MNKEFIPYEQALALKGLGFDEECFAVYYDSETHVFLKEFKTYTGAWVKFNSEFDGKGVTSAPLYQQAFRWFREKHGLHANINSVGDSTQYGFIPNGKYSGTIDDVTIGKEMIATDTVCLIPIGDTYEEAEQACLDKLIKLVKEKQ